MHLDSAFSFGFGRAKLEANLLPTYDFVKNGEAQIDEAALKELFSKLSKDKALIVYSNTGVKASLVWFALMLMGYDGRLYSWKDWLESQPALNLGLKEIRSEPNPAASGTTVRIVAAFGEGKLNRTVEEPNKITKQSVSNETILTIKGCVTCEPITIYTGGSLSGTKEGGAKLAPSARLRPRPSRVRPSFGTMWARRLP